MEHYQEKIGEGLVRVKALTLEQCEEILELQRSGDKRLFGDIALSKGYIDFDTLIQYLRTSGQKA